MEAADGEIDVKRSKIIDCGEGLPFVLIRLVEIVISHDKTASMIPGGHERTHETHTVEENLEDPIL